MNKISRWLLVVGVFLVLISLFFHRGDSYAINLSLRRIVLLGLGCLSIISAVLNSYFRDRISNGLQNLAYFIARHPLTHWLNKRQFVESDDIGKFRYINRVAFLWSLLILSAYVWFASAGQWSSLPRTTNYYDQLANAFARGQLYLEAVPGTQEKIPKPIDFSLYEGKYYLYFGPTPALFLAALKAIFHVQMGDQFITLILLSGSYIFQGLLILLIWRKFFWKLSVWTAFISFPVVGFLNPVVYMLVTARVYESAIAAGQFFFMGGLYFACLALQRLPHSMDKLFISGSFLIFSLGARITLAMSIGILIIFVVCWTVKSLYPSDIVNMFKCLMLFIAPFVLGLILLGSYNYGRFDAVYETGFSYTSMGLKLHSRNLSPFNTGFMFQNLYNYFISPPRILDGFPFLSANGINTKSVIPFIDLPSLYTGEQLTGLLWSSPFSIFSLISVLPLINKMRDSKISFIKNIDFLTCLFISLFGFVALVFGPLLLFFWATMRYTMDFVPSLAIMSVSGFWQGYSLLKNHIQVFSYSFVAISLAAISIFMSLSLGFSINLWWIGYFK